MSGTTGEGFRKEYKLSTLSGGGGGFGILTTGTAGEATTVGIASIGDVGVYT